MTRPVRRIRSRPDWSGRSWLRRRGPVPVGSFLIGSFLIGSCLVGSGLVGSGPAAAVAAVASTGPPATPMATIEVTAASPWVDPDGDFRVELRVTSPVPPEARLRTSIHQRLRATSRATLRQVLGRATADDELPGLLQAPTTRPLSELGDPAVGIIVDIPVRSSGAGSADRVLLPTAGIHPVTLSVLDVDDDPVASTTVFLNRLPTTMPTAADGSPGVMAVSMYTLVDGPAALSPAGATDLDPDARTALSAAADLVSAVPEAPLTLAVRPNLLTAISRSQDPVDQRILELLRGVWKAPAHAVRVARMPYVRVDTGGLVAAQDGAAELLRQVALGDRAVRDALGTEPDPTTWFGDDTVTTESLDLVQQLGARRLVTSADRLHVSTRGGDAADLVTHSFALSPSRLTTTAPDPVLTATLRNGGSAGSQANQIVTELMATWFTADSEAGSFPGPSAVIAVPPSTDPAVLRLLVPTLTIGGPLSADPAAVPDRAGRIDGREATATLTNRATPDQGPAVRGVIETRVRVDGYRSFAPSATTETAEWELLESQTLERDMSSTDRSRYSGHVRAEIDTRLRQIEMPQERRVVLASRSSTIPLRFRNGLPYDVTIELWTRSVRLDVGGGDRRIVVLKPGENRIDLPVTARAPGGTLLRVDASSPDGTLVLPSVAIPVTASTISGVGAALSVLSLLFLAGWWITTIRRSRRNARRSRHRRRVGPADDHPSDDPTGGATHDPALGAGPTAPDPPTSGATSSVDAGG